MFDSLRDRPITTTEELITVRLSADGHWLVRAREHLVSVQSDHSCLCTRSGVQNVNR